MEILCEFGMAFVGGPVGWCAVPEDVFKIEPCAVFEEEVNERLVPCPGCLMERGCVGVAADGVVAVGIFAGGEEDMDDLDVAILRGEGEGQVAVVRA